MNRNLRLTVLLLAACTLAATLAMPCRAGEARAHDGFFLRLSTGLGTASTEIDLGGVSAKVSGMSGDADIAIGAVVGRNLALHATLFGWTVSNPDFEVSGTQSLDTDGTAMLAAYGVGATYYFMPANFYLTGSLGMGSVTFDFDVPSVGGTVDDETESGLAFTLGVGKEWWVGKSWGLGLSGNYTYQSAEDSSVSENWSGSAFAVRFSATFN